MSQLVVLIKMLLFWAVLMVIGVVAYHIGDDHSLSMSISDMPSESFSRLVTLTLVLSIFVIFFEHSLRKKFRR